jgi:hypothetical protein
MFVLIASILLGLLGLELKVLLWWRQVDGLVLMSLQASIFLAEIKHVSLRASSDNNMLNYES